MSTPKLNAQDEVVPSTKVSDHDPRPCCCCCKNSKDDDSDPNHWDRMKEWADFIIKIKEFLIAIGTILAVMVMVRTAIYLTNNAKDSAEAIGKGIAMIGSLAMGQSMSNVAKASTALRMDLDPDMDAILDAGDAALDRANGEAKAKFWGGGAW